MRSILKCLKFCQNKGVQHRDIKCENIMLMKSKKYKSLKLIDFGFGSFIND
jgi:serine/threonine protein kinase